MTKQQTVKLAASIVEHQAALAEMSTEDAQWAIQNAKAAIALFILAVKNREQYSWHPVLCIPVLIIRVELTRKFVVNEFFKVNTEECGPGKIASFNDSFKAWFLGKTEDLMVHKIDLCHYRLDATLMERCIIEKFGGEAKVETTLAEIAALMSKQNNSEKDVIFSTDFENRFYVRDLNGFLRTVSVYCYKDGWHVGASAVRGVGSVDGGTRVFFRNSST